MRRVALAVIVLVAASCRLASAAAISVAGADCGTDPLLGLTFTTATGTNLPLVLNGSGVACPSGGIGLGAIIGEPGSGDAGPLYGLAITSIEFEVSDPAQLDGLEILKGSALDHLTLTRTGFVLTGDPGIEIGCTILFDVEGAPIVCSPKDALITFSGFEPDTTFSVAAVNGIAAVPEPASLTLLGIGTAAAAAIRRRRQTRSARPAAQPDGCRQT
jgi:hypothetical protein